MSDQAALWAWFLFESGLSAQRAKHLLLRWQREGHALPDVLARLPAGADALGLTREEAAALRPPASLPEVNALPWDDAFYPAELQTLPAKLRPALLFFAGPEHLLMYPLLYLAPGTPDEAARELLREVVGMLLGEVLPIAFRGSVEATVLIEEMESSAGAALFVARQGLKGIAWTPQERALLAEERLLVVTPLPPTAPVNPAWDAYMYQVAQGMARRCIATDLAALSETGAPPTLLLTPSAPQDALPDHVTLARTPADALVWLGDYHPAPADYPTPRASHTPDADALLIRDAPLAPPPTPEETLRVLEGGGRVPDALRKRLAGE